MTESSDISDNITSCFSKNQRIDLDFINRVKSDSLNVFDFHYLYNGGGVGIGDFNNDGIKDIFLGGNLVRSALLVGTGDLEYTNRTVEAGLTTKAWVNGISIVDINHDGWVDIYLSIGGPNCTSYNCKNLLFINHSSKDKVSFIESSVEYQLDIPLYSQQGLFVDVDRDGDLDLYQLQNHVDPTTKNYPKPKQYFSKDSYDRLFINQEIESGKITFVDRSKEWGISKPGFGLGVVASDFNQDGYTDLYVANDFISDDILYINNEGKGFADHTQAVLKHTSYNSMGVDVGDVNGDLLQDIMVLDMLPYNNARQKTMLGASNYDKYLLSQKEKYNKQYIRNTLQLSNGKKGNKLLSFTDVAPHFGVHETDWSWSPLIMDFDNDQDNDIFVTNGYGKNITDLDFVNYNSNIVGFGDKKKIEEQIKKDVKNLPPVNLPNHYYINCNTGFDKVVDFKHSISNGAAYSDLDNDGDLDLILNNLNEPASILVNNSSNNYLKIKLKGPDLNTYAIGTKIELTLGSGKKLQRDINPVRSYLSTMDTDQIIGLNQDSVIQIQLTWPDNTRSILDKVLVNTSIEIDYSNIAKEAFHVEMKKTKYESDTVIIKKKDLLAAHDFSIQPLLFKSCISEHIRMAQFSDGMKVAVANIDNHLYSFTHTGEQELMLELDDVVSDLITFDITEDDTEELIVAVYPEDHSHSSLLILHQENRKWEIIQKLELSFGIYSLHLSNNRVFVSSFPSAKDYPSHENTIYELDLSNNKFDLVANPFNIEVSGCITDIEFADLNQDNLDDIIIVGEWMSPQIYFQDANGYKKASTSFSEMTGMWQDVCLSDLDGDGDLDAILGNLGTNSRLSATKENPIQIVNDDLDNNGSIDPIMSMYNSHDNEDFSYASKDDLARKLPGVSQNYTSYAAFSKASYEEILNHFKKKVKRKSITCLNSLLLQNDGKGEFKVLALPKEAQLSMINKIETINYNSDSLPDLMLLTNYDMVEMHNGELNGLNSLVLLNEGEFDFKAVQDHKTGISISESAYDMITFPNGKFWVSTSEGIYNYDKN